VSAHKGKKINAALADLFIADAQRINAAHIPRQMGSWR
jgi:hypothetical protein